MGNRDAVELFERAGAESTLMDVADAHGWDVANRVVANVMSARDPVSAADAWAARVEADRRGGSVTADQALVRSEEVASTGSHTPDGVGRTYRGP